MPQRVKRTAAREWVDQAIACGAEPCFHQSPVGCIEPGSWWLCMKTHGVDWEKYPQRLPDALRDDAFKILDAMGRCNRAKEVQP